MTIEKLKYHSIKSEDIPQLQDQLANYFQTYKDKQFSRYLKSYVDSIEGEKTFAEQVTSLLSGQYPM